MFFRFYIDGALLGKRCRRVEVVVKDRNNKFMEGWDTNVKDLIRVWCGALGMNDTEYVVTEPEFEDEYGVFVVLFNQPVTRLQPTPRDERDLFFDRLAFTMHHMMEFVVDDEEEEDEVEPENEDGVNDDPAAANGEEIVGDVVNEFDVEDEIYDEDAAAEFDEDNEVEGEEEWYSCDEEEWYAAEADY